MQVDLANYLKRYWLVLVLSGVVSAVIALAVTFFLSPAYESTTRVMVMPRNESVASGAMVNPSGTYFGTNADVAVSRSVLEATVESLGMDKAPSSRSLLSSVKEFLARAFMFLRFGSPHELSARDAAIGVLEKRVEAEVLEDSGIVGITATWKDPEVAKAIADEVAKQYVAASKRLTAEDSAKVLEEIQAGFAEREGALAAATKALAEYKEANGISERYDPVGPTGLSPEVRAQLGKLEARLTAAEGDYEYWRDLYQGTQAEGMTEGERTEVLGEANVPAYPVAPDRLLYVAVGFLVGLLFGLGGATWMELSNRTIYTADDVRAVVGDDVEVVAIGSRAGGGKDA